MTTFEYNEVDEQYKILAKQPPFCNYFYFSIVCASCTYFTCQTGIVIFLLNFTIV